MTPYYQDDAVTIYHADNLDVLPELIAHGHLVDAVLTDPPYDQKTHKGARTNAHEGELIDFSALGYGGLVKSLDYLSQLKPAWGVFTCADAYVAKLEEESKLPGKLRFVRKGVWDKMGTGAPQITGDRPAMGWESVAHLWGDGKKRALQCWSGGGRDSVYRHPISRRRKNKTEKPLTLLTEWVGLFTTPGGLVVDPWGGSGTTARACKDMGRKCIMVEVREEQCEAAAIWMMQEVLPGMAA